MNKNIIATLILLVITGQRIIAQQGTAFFKETMYNYGIIKESKGAVSATFTFTNIGKGNLKILAVDVACGCTVPDWPKGEMKPGEKGTIEVLFNPKNYSGEFAKSLTVKTNGDPRSIFLTIGGIVVDDAYDIKKTYPVVQGNARFTASHVDFKSISNQHIDSAFVVLYNNSKRPLTITGFKTPPFIKAEAQHRYIPAGKLSQITYIYYPQIAKDLGQRTDETYIYTDDDTLREKIVIVKANIFEDFSILTEEQKKNAPKLIFTTTEKSIDELYLGETGKYQFEFVNKGKSDLIIRKVAGSCGCTVADYTDKPIKKGKKGVVTVSLNTTNMRGKQAKSVTVYSNDPENPVITLKINAKVVIPGIEPIKDK